MEESVKKKPARLRMFFTRLVTTLIVLLLLAAFYIAVVMGDPSQDSGGIVGEEPATPAPMQSVLPGQPARNIGQGEDTALLTASFPAAYLNLAVEGVSLVGGQAYDSAFEGGFARVLVLTYQGDSGAQIQLTSIYPARAYDILGKSGYSDLSTDTYSLASQPAVRMDGSKGLRIHAQGEQALYALSAPELTQEELGKLLKGVHLVQAP